MLKQNLMLLGISSLLILQFIVVPYVYAIEEFDTIDVGSSPIQIAINQNTNTIYATNQANTILVIDGSDKKIMDVINMETFPRGITVNVETDTIYVTNPLDGTVSLIDGSNNEVVDSINVGTLPRGIAVNPEINTIYVTHPLDDMVSVIDGSNNEVVDSITVANGSFGIAVNELTNTIYTVSCFYEIAAVSVIDGSTNTLGNPLPIEDCAWTIAVNPQTNTFFVANPTLNSLFVFDDVVIEPEIETSSEPVILSNPVTSEIPSESVLTKKIETVEIPTPTQITEEPVQNSLDMFAFLGIIMVGVIVGIISIKKMNKRKPVEILENNGPDDRLEKNVQKAKKSIAKKLQNRFSDPPTEIVKGIDVNPMIENKINLILKLEKYHIGDKVKLDEIKNSLLVDGAFTKTANDYIETQYEQYKKIALISD